MRTVRTIATLVILAVALVGSASAKGGKKKTARARVNGNERMPEDMKGLYLSDSRQFTDKAQQVIEDTNTTQTTREMLQAMVAITRVASGATTPTVQDFLGMWTQTDEKIRLQILRNVGPIIVVRWAGPEGVAILNALEDRGIQEKIGDAKQDWRAGIAVARLKIFARLGDLDSALMALSGIPELNGLQTNREMDDRSANLLFRKASPEQLAALATGFSQWAKALSEKEGENAQAWVQVARLNAFAKRAQRLAEIKRAAGAGL